jgi:hypothetical protein
MINISLVNDVLLSLRPPIYSKNGEHFLQRMTHYEVALRNLRSEHNAFVGSS